MAKPDPLSLARVRLLLAFGLTYLAGFVPGLSLVLNWFVTYFHEASHGLVALASGGSVGRMVLNMNGTGYVLAQSGSPFWTLLAGYAGSFVWGALMVRMALAAGPHFSRPAACLLAVLIGITAFLWIEAGDMNSWIIAAVLCLVFAWTAYQPDRAAARLMLLFLGASILLNGFLLVLNLHTSIGIHGSGRSLSDAAGLARLTGWPPLAFTSMWLAIGAAACFYVWRVAAACDRLVHHRLHRA